MKKILAILVMVLMGTVAFAQGWDNTTNPPHIFNTNTGNVGIGTGAAFVPAWKLHVNTVATGPATLMLESTVESGAMSWLRMKNTTSGHIANFVLRKNGPNYELVQSCYDPVAGSWGEYLYFNFTNHKYEIRTGINDAEFKNNGNVFFNNVGSVGIGVTSFGTTTGTGTTAKLQVNGPIICKELEVRVSPWPDHVFKAGYKLRSLDEVETFIKANNHLPDVPSAQEVENNGMNVGQISATLLQKIEELTLYVIDLKKENEKLKMEIQKRK